MIGLEDEESNMIILVREFGIYAINGLLRNAYLNSRETDLTQMAEETIKILSKSSQNLDELKAEICELVSEIIEINHTQKLAAGTKTKLEDLENEWPSIEASLTELKSLTDPNRSTFSRLKEILKGRLAKEVSPQAKQIKEIIDEEMDQYLADSRAIELAGPLVEVLNNINQSYQEKKRRLNAMDFTDLEGLTIKLLKNNFKICNTYQEKYKLSWLISEFQDTNPVQEELVRLLVGGSIDAPITGNKLFIVGDPKQSIYRFRGADVTVFKGLREEINQIGKNILLDLNFRSRGKIIDFVNHFFRQVFGTDENNQYDMGYEPSYFNRTGNPNDSCIELMVLDKTQFAEEDINSREEEANHLARRIQKMVCTKEKLVYENNRDSEDRCRSVRYGDICILFQALTDVQIYEEALQRYQIPYTVVKGRGFFERQEVRDLMNFLKIIDNPNREIEWIGVLRSPFCGLSDKDLFLLSKNGNKISQVAKCQKMIEGLDEKAKGRLLSFLRVFQSLSKDRDRKEISALISEMLSKTGYRQLMVTHPYGDLIQANLNKLLLIARQYEKNSYASLAGFIKYIDQMEQNAVREGMDEIPGQHDRVQLMSIHQSKGLEFPVVILPDVGRQLINYTNFPAIFFDTELGLGLKVKDPLTNKSIKTSLFNTILEVEKQREIAERKRLLYVAVTRAREYLFISGSSKDFKIDEIDSGRNWLDWLAQIFKLSKPDELPDELLYGKENQHRIELCQKVEEIDIPELAATYETVGVKELKDMCHNSVPSVCPRGKSGFYEFSPTALMTFSKCPRWYYYSNIEKMPLSVVDPLQSLTLWDVQKDEFVVKGAERGSVIHFLCEKAQKLEEVPEILAKGIRQLRLNQLLLKPKAQERLLKDVKPVMEQYFEREAELYQEFNSDQFEEYRELSFDLVLDHSLIRGTVDRVLMTEDRLLILDYKTNQIKKDEFEEESKKYKLQMEIYALALYQLTGIERIQCKLYFMEVDRFCDFHFNLPELKEIQQNLSRLTDEINKAESEGVVSGFLSRFPCAAEPDKCLYHKFCSYQRLCYESVKKHEIEGIKRYF